ncbi:Ni,Fe-hydrogenase III large subunit [Rhodanobacter glycinis]|uniref:Ni,Fe-hydrogenase III large subunit n=1 Tax=Rhodanobacter glycinis TaxID=582702 RepID=A0A502FLR7_9GAMM|nr:NADH-quinone oxidoreductase subunit C [Rhodanobacter glycinis]TPG05926.1 Ni,Fe-hydrogenase III large subunit [Rhodanobacter glycinis]TPG50487.1 Ni,Fe-hydrogenase III large subunit [Rhodanobacter glycinis]
MSTDFLEREGTRLPANVAVRRVLVDAAQWSQSAQSLRDLDACLLALWGADDRDVDGMFRIFAAFLLPDHVLLLQHAMPAATPVYPSLAGWFPVADRLQRAVYDLLGLQPDAGDRRPWLRHGGWPDDHFPLRRDSDSTQTFPVEPAPYSFVPVSGDGVHEIAVGPVHAGTIEPGHFRFSVVGEKVLRLEARLGYTHKGIAKRFEGLPLAEGHHLAARICGDSTVAFSWAYCAALESITDTELPRRAASLRALALERERLANHLGDLGALGNDAGLAFGLVQFSSLKEQLLRLNQEAFGKRYLFDYLVPGGVVTDLGMHAIRAMLDEATMLEQAVATLRTIYDDHAGLQDRFRDAGQVSPELARAHGALGLAGRASGTAQDVRIDLPWPPYDWLRPRRVLRFGGDVAARVLVRFDEIIESLRLCRSLLETLPAGPSLITLPTAATGRLGLGLIEGWRGPVLIALETAADNRVRRCHAHDPSWQNWPLVEYAIHGNIVPDFPLINKSFNLAYSGHDG